MAKIISNLRNARGLTQADLCTQAGLSLYTVHRLERGDHVRPGTMKLILEALGRFERVPKATAERIAGIYRFSVNVISPSALSEGAGFDAIGPATAKELHLLLDRAINSAGEMPTPAQTASLHTIQAVLSSIAGEAPTPSLIKRHPPVRVGDRDVEVVEPVNPPDTKRKSG